MFVGGEAFKFELDHFGKAGGDLGVEFGQGSGLDPERLGWGLRGGLDEEVLGDEVLKDSDGEEGVALGTAMDEASEAGREVCLVEFEGQEIAHGGFVEGFEGKFMGETAHEQVVAGGF